MLNNILTKSNGLYCEWVTLWLESTTYSFLTPLAEQKWATNHRFQLICSSDSVTTCRENPPSKYIHTIQRTGALRMRMRIRRGCPFLQPIVDSVPKRIIQQIICGTQSRAKSPWRSLRQSRLTARFSWVKTFNTALRKTIGRFFLNWIKIIFLLKFSSNDDEVLRKLWYD